MTSEKNNTSMSQCPNCGKQMKGFWGFCTNCGSKIESKQASESLEEANLPAADEKRPAITNGFDIEELSGGIKNVINEYDRQKKSQAAALPEYKNIDCFEDDPFIDKGWENWVKVKLAIYKERVLTEQADIKILEESLKKWMSTVDPDNYRKMFSKIKIGQVVEYPYYSVSVATVLEKRDKISDFERPYKNEKLYKKSANRPQESDLWNYKSTDNIIFLSSQQVFDIPDSIETELCPKCRGAKVVCDHCFGKGSITCGECSGTGKIKCKSCRGGSGKSCTHCGGRGSAAGQKCAHCGGSGFVKCTDCDAGSMLCPRCAGKSKTLCTHCNGTGQDNCKKCGSSGSLIKGLEFTSSFRLFVGDAVFENPLINAKAVQFNRELLSAETIIAEIIVKKIVNYDFLEGIQYAAVKTKAAELIQNSYKQMADLSKIRRQKFVIRKYPVWAMSYIYEGRSYVIYFKSAKHEVAFADSPFHNLAGSSISAAKKYLFKLDFKNAQLACDRASKFEQYIPEAKKIKNKVTLLFNLFYFVDGLLGAMVGALVCIVFFLPSVKMTYNAFTPIAAILIFAVFSGFLMSFLSRLFINLRVNSFKVILLVPFLLSCLAVCASGFFVFKKVKFNPYTYLDQKYFEREFARRFPYGISSIFIAEDYRTLVKMREQFSDFNLDKSKIENGIKLQESLMKQAHKKKTAADKPAKTDTLGAAKSRSEKQRQQMDIKWLNKKK